MKNAELRDLSTKELVDKIEIEVDLYTKMKINHSITPLENPNLIKQTRRNIARLKTLLSERVKSNTKEL